MNSVAQEMMALLRSKSPYPGDDTPDKQNYTSGMTPDMYDESVVLVPSTSNRYDDYDDEYYEELAPYGHEDMPLEELPVSSDSAKLRQLEE